MSGEDPFARYAAQELMKQAPILLVMESIRSFFGKGHPDKMTSLAMQAALKEGAHGCYLTMEFQRSEAVRLSEGYSDSKLLFYQGTCSIPDSFLGGEVNWHADGSTLSDLLACRNAPYQIGHFKRGVPRIESVWSIKDGDYSFSPEDAVGSDRILFDISPLGDSSRKAMCGKPLGLDEPLETARRISADFPFIFGGGIVRSPQLGKRYTIDRVMRSYRDLLEKTGVGKPPAGIVVGKPITGQAPAGAKSETARYLAELEGRYRAYFGDVA